jgi:hypothetical protein
MAKMKKEQQQVLMLSVVLGLIGAVLLYFYWDKLLPRPEGEELAPPPARLLVPGVDDKAFYERQDFRSLKAFGDVPVRALPGNGSPDPFKSEEKK